MTAISAHEANLASVLNDNNLYIVPPYQRNYSWDSEQVNTLWRDLLRTVDSDRPYFLGSFVFVSGDSPGIFDILDGQQRLSTLLLMVSAFKKVIREYGGEKPLPLVMDRILFCLNPDDSNAEVTHLRLNHQDQSYFDALIRNGASDTPQHHSHKLLKRTFVEFSQKISDEAQARKITPIQLWNDIWQAFSSKLFVIRITAATHMNAQQVFQALNSAGMDLSQADLIKNYILMETGKHQQAGAIQAWTEMVQEVGDDKVTEFIRAHWNSTYSFVRTNDLFSTLQTRIKRQPKRGSDEIDVVEYLTSLRKESTTFDRLKNPAVEYWGNGTEMLEQHLSDIGAMGVQMAYVPLLACAALLAKDVERLTEVARWFLVFTVRHGIVGGRAANEVEELYSEMAVALRQGRLSLEELKEKLMDLAPNDEIFKSDLLRFSVKRQRTALIMLSRINDLQDRENAIRKTITKGGKVHLEHIIPQSPTKWQAFLEAEEIDHEEVVTKFGNLTLLLGPKNQEASNRTFGEKLEVYKGGGNPEPINRDLATLSRFGAPELAARQAWLAEQALKVWAW